MSHQWNSPEGELKRTEAENGQVMWFLNGERIPEGNANEILKKMYQKEPQEPKESREFDVEVRKNQTVRFRDSSDEDIIKKREFDTVKIFDEFIVGEKEGNYPLKIDNIQVVELV